MNKLTLLIVDDIEANRISLEYLLKKYYDDIDIIMAGSGEEALKETYTKEIDIIILDIQMPGMDGFEVAQFLQSNPKTKHIPIIFLTAAFVKEEFQQKGFELGAIDYLTKPIDDLQLINKLRLYKEIIFKTKELEEKNKLLEKLVDTDNLTQLYNRVKLDETLISETNRSKRFASSFGIILIDIDHFKEVNDTHGHQMGDTVLKEFAQILKSHSRKTDTVGRWGGEEFMIICPETEIEGILSLANALKEKISLYPFSLGEQKTASFGVTIYIKDEKIDTMIKRADDALYEAKKNGRDRVESL